MFTKKEIKQNLIGCAEICMFMRSGVERFSSDRKAALKSFILPALCVPVVLYVISLQWTDFPDSVLFPLQVLRISGTLALFYVAVYFLSIGFDRKDHFYQFINVSNWVALPLVLLVVPIAFLVGFDLNTYDNLENYAIFTAICGYILTGFVATHALRVPWQMGAFIAIVSLAINDVSWQLAEFVKASFAA